MRRGTVLLLFAAPALAGSVAAQSRVATNLNTHSEVTIERPAAAIWAHIVDPSAWKHGARLLHQAGPAGAVGEVFAAVDPSDTSRVAFFLENVELVENRRRTIKLYVPNGALIGFATWTLRERGSRTVVGYDVYSETRLEAAQVQSMTSAQLQEAERSSFVANQKRFDQELLALKRLVEANR